MIDLAYTRDHWLMPDGSVVVRSCEGTSGSMGTVYPTLPQPAPSPDAVPISGGAKYVGTQRHLSPAAEALCRSIIERESGEPFDPNRRYCIAAGADYGSTLVHRIANGITFDQARKAA